MRVSFVGESVLNSDPKEKARSLDCECLKLTTLVALY